MKTNAFQLETQFSSFKDKSFRIICLTTDFQNLLTTFIFGLKEIYYLTENILIIKYFI